MATTTVIKTRIQFRRATTADWLLNKDVIPAAGEPCFDLDLKTLKIGDGITTYENLPVIGGVDVSADGKSIILEDGAFKIAGFDVAETGAQPRKNAEGNIEWVVPSTETVEGLQTTVAGLQSDITALQEIVTPSGEDATPLLTRVETLEEQVNGTGEGSVDKKIDAKINEFATKINDNDVVDSYKELIDYVAEHGGEAATMAADITALKGLVGEKSVSEQITEAIANIETGAQENVIESIKVGGTLLDVVEKSVNIPVATDSALGVVKASEEVTVAEDGTLGIGTISFSKIVQGEDEVIVFDGGASAQ
jgi:hypothetical protein